jgi:replication factor C subunit 2/4
MLDDDIFESERNEQPKANITFNMAQNTTHNIAQNTTYNYNTVPWVEKYRPKKINNVVKQNEVVKMLTKTLETGHMPNLLFYGPPGIGKTTTILAAVAQMFGPDKIEERVIELNASDDRGINVVRDTIIAFAKRVVGTPDPAYPSPPFKVIILDEADAMTPEAQAALRKVMEMTTNITRFCFICNYITKIIEPIVSRCMKFRFKPIDEETICKQLTHICAKENLKLDGDVIQNISRFSDGDLRKAIMTLQNIKYTQTVSKIQDAITMQDYDFISGIINVSLLNTLWDISLNKKIADIKAYTDIVGRSGFQIQTIILFLKDNVISNKMINNKILTEDQAAKILIKISDIERVLIEGASEKIQLLLLCAYINGVVNNYV